jgi:hypothetical protein
LPLLLPIPLDGGGMVVPIASVIIGMGVSPLLATIADYLRILRIGFDLVAVIIGTALALAVLLAANALIGTELGLPNSFK